MNVYCTLPLFLVFYSCFYLNERRREIVIFYRCPFSTAMRWCAACFTIFAFVYFYCQVYTFVVVVPQLSRRRNNEALTYSNQANLFRFHEPNKKVNIKILRRPSKGRTGHEEKNEEGVLLPSSVLMKKMTEAHIEQLRERWRGNNATVSTNSSVEENLGKAFRKLTFCFDRLLSLATSVVQLMDQRNAFTN